MTERSSRVNFLFLGGDKCGSTWLDFILRQHPEVCLAPSKELFFFDRFFERGLAWYDRQFPETKTAVRTGEICHDYLYSDAALARIGAALPADARCLIVLRHPVERTLSHYRYLLKIGTTRAPLADALRQHPGLLDHSLYAPRLAAARRAIGNARLCVLFYDDLARDPAGFGRRVSDALGLRYLPELPYDTRVLGAAGSRAPGLTRVLRNAGWGLRRRGAQRLVSTVKSSALVQRLLFTETARSAVDRTALTPYLERFRADHAALSAMLETPPAWTFDPP
ncbi:sulfotransferase family protein [Roseobacter sinensis]|uniref:Sulfotransferase n=1 Tax=Roseobacter sinensis TaxID=2931391 RepID=A0ABT3BK56_9RHOB|nr:sulfotransferase [Roseobacter sp. WL0113]MCV3273956.1 sulfotransferase [Roseobacter sp. WL0113]